MRVNQDGSLSEASATGALQQDFCATLLSIIDNHAPEARQHGIAVAYSGGLDSSVLLDLASRFGARHQITIHACHVNHGLSVNADAWQQICASVAQQSGAIFHTQSVSVDTKSGAGTEASARIQRYLALGQLCAARHIPLLLTAHHQDDQAETVLMQLLRGAGLAGLSGMSECNHAQSLLGFPDIVIARPLLTRSKKILTNYARSIGIQFVDDESNTDIRFARNALRHQVMPVLDSLIPGYAERITRSAKHAQSASRLLQDLAEIDMQRCYFSDALQIDPMRTLSIERIDNLLRHWMFTLNIRMPSAARLSEIRHQILSARDDARVSIHHEQVIFHRYQSKIFVEAVKILNVDESVQFVWQGEASIKFPAFDGTLYVEPAQHGLDPSWLRSQRLSLRWRQGGEKMRLGKNRPSRDMKKHFQTLKIPFWMRERLPYVLIGDQVLFAAGVGINGDFMGENDKESVQLRWQIGK